MALARPNWTRLEPRPRDPTLATGLRAEVHDPLWLLARQRQFGELQGEDAGSPVRVDLDAISGKLTRYLPRKPDNTPGQTFNSRNQPLESLVEAEPTFPNVGHPVRLAVTTGLRFLALLREHKVGQYAKSYVDHRPLPTGQRFDAATDRFLSLVAGRVPDGTALYAELRTALQASDNQLPVEPVISPGDLVSVTSAATAFLGWFSVLAGPDDTDQKAWVPTRFEYQFSVAGQLGDKEVVLTADEYDQGQLDWDSFNIGPAGSSLGVTANEPGSTAAPARTGLPTPVTYRGMPNSRFWQFEDAAVDFGDLTAARQVDNAKLLMIEFAMTYGNDHFVVPVDIEVGTLHAVEHLTVLDTFGLVTEVRHVSDADEGKPHRFRLFELATTAAADRSSLFFLPPTVGRTSNGPPIEQVNLLRDEGANLGWALEVIAGHNGGFPVDRASAWRDPLPPTHDPNAEASWRYRVRTELPDFWFPLVPVDDALGSNHLELRSMTALDSRPISPPWGQILAELAPNEQPVPIPEEEVSRGAARIVRGWQYARWTDGHQHAWIGRRRQSITNSDASGLRYDTIDLKAATGEAGH